MHPWVYFQSYLLPFRVLGKMKEDALHAEGEVLLRNSS